MTSYDKTLLDKIGAHESHRLEVNAANLMADEAMLASALGGVTERRNAHYDA